MFCPVQHSFGCPTNGRCHECNSGCTSSSASSDIATGSARYRCAGYDATTTGKRVLGVLPNYRTANWSANYEPITAKQKITIALKDSFDYPLIGVGAAYAGLYQLENSHRNLIKGLKDI